MLKQQRVESQHIRRAAQGERCTLQIVGVCNGRTDTTVLAHLPDESHGISRKSDDLSGAFGCDACHSVIDGRAAWPAGERHIGSGISAAPRHAHGAGCSSWA